MNLKQMNNLYIMSTPIEIKCKHCYLCRAGLCDSCDNCWMSDDEDMD